MEMTYLRDLEIISMHASSPLFVKQSLIVKLLKTYHYGSHKVKRMTMKRLKLYKSAAIILDTDEKISWSKKHIGGFAIQEDKLLSPFIGAKK